MPRKIEWEPPQARQDDRLARAVALLREVFEHREFGLGITYGGGRRADLLTVEDCERCHSYGRHKEPIVCRCYCHKIRVYLREVECE